MNKSLGINGGVNYIRHSVISTFINGNETDPAKRLELANKSFHSPITQIRYIRNIVDDIKE